MLWTLIRCGAAVGVALLLRLEACSQDTEKPKPASVNIKPEPIVIKSGDPLSVRALVQRPPAIKTALSWTIEPRRHRGYLYGFATNPDGSRVATGGLDGIIRIWDSATGKLIRALVGHDSYCYNVSWSPDGNTIASAGSFDGTVRFWDAKSGLPLRKYAMDKGYATHVSWSPDGRRLVAAGGTSGYLWLWEADSDKGSTLTETGQPITALAWTPDSKMFAVCCTKLAVQVYNAEVGKASTTFGNNAVDHFAAAWSPDGKLFITGDATAATVWDFATGKKVREIPGQTYHLAWSPNGKMIATAASAGATQIWSDDGKPIRTLTNATYGLRWTAADTIHSRDYFRVLAWDVASGKTRNSFEVADTSPPYWASGKPLMTGIGTATLKLWDPINGKFLRSLEGHGSGITVFSWGRDGKTLATGSADKTVRLWDTSSGRLLQTLKGHTATVTALAWAAQGGQLASGGADKAIHIWSTSGGKPQKTLSGHEAAVNALAWGRYLVSGSEDESVRIWDMTGNVAPKSLRAVKPVQCVAISPDGKTLAAGCYDHRIRLWNMAGGKDLAELEYGGSPPQVACIAWSPNGQVLASGRSNHTVQFWNLKDPSKPLQNLAAMGPVVAIGWTPGGSTVATANHERTTRFWDAATGQLRGSYVAETGHIAAVSADGHFRSEISANDPELFYVVLTKGSMDTLPPSEFAAKFKWKNNPSQVRLTGK